MAFAQKPVAVRRLVKGPDGVTRVMFVDPKTGAQIKNPAGYQIVDARNQSDFGRQINQGGNQQGQQPEVQTPQGADQGVKPDTPQSLSQRLVSGDFRGERPAIAAAAQSGTPQTMTSKAQFGENYINKPGWAGFAGMLPGPLGLVGTAANMGVNANNTAAVNNQRETLGFANKSALSNVGSTLMDKQGYIGDQYDSRSQNVTPVGFEANDKFGRTTFTPEEARMRNEIAPKDTVREATAAETSNAVSAYQDQYGTKGFLSALSTAAKGIFSGLFGSTPSSSNQPSGGVSSKAVNPMATNNGGYRSGFPDTPSKPTQTTSNNQQYDRDSQGGSTPSNPGGVGLY